MNRWRIRAARPDDTAMLSALERTAFGARSWGADSLSGSLSAPGVFVLLGHAPDAPPCGFALWRLLEEEAEILTLGVTPPARRQGLGAALLAALIEAARAEKAQRLFLEVDAGNEAALGLYQRQGFSQIDVRPGYYRDGADALVLRLAL